MRNKISRRKLPWYFLLCFVCTFFVPTGLYASVYYVTTNGADSNVGSEISPFRTIKKGVTVLSPGDTLYVKEGTYSETILSWKTPIPNGTSWEKPITVAAFPGHTVNITPPSETAFFWIKDGMAKYLIVDGFRIDGQNKALHGFKFHQGVTHVRVQNSEIKNSKSQGILVAGCSTCYEPHSLDTYMEFINLDVHHNGSSFYDHGFYIATGVNLVENCHVHHNASFGVHWFSAYYPPGGNHSESASYNISRFNTIHDNGQKPWLDPTNPDKVGSGIAGLLVGSGEGNEAYGNISYNQHHGISIGFGSKNALIYNNIVYDNSEVGIEISGSFGGSMNTRVFNNSVYNNGQNGIRVSHNGENTIIRNNIAFQNGSDKSRNIWLEPGQSPGTVTSNNLIENPLFIDSLAHNFRLQPGSPAIDVGLTIPEVTIDFFGFDRSQGIAYDIGAIEHEIIPDNIAPGTPINFQIIN